MGRVSVIKNDHTGREVWRYEGSTLARGATSLKLEASFDMELKDMGFVVLRRGDRFIEYHYGDRWYCIFEIHDREDDRLKGWYCNLQRPAELGEDFVRADDLALDLFVHPDGRRRVLDREAFDALPLEPAERQAVLGALRELEEKVERREPPFDGLVERARSG